MTFRSKIETHILIAAALSIGIATAAQAGRSHIPVRVPTLGLHQPVWPQQPGGSTLPGHTGNGDVQKGQNYPEGGPSCALPARHCPILPF